MFIFIHPKLLLKVFVTSDQTHIKAHRIIIALSSDLLKQFDHSTDLKILLPEFSPDVVSSFVEFCYSGEVLLPLNLRNEFLSLCHHMLVNVPTLDNFFITTNEEDLEDVQNNEEDSENLIETEYEEEDVEDTKFVEIEEEESETIFEEKLSEETEDDIPHKSHHLKPFKSKPNFDKCNNPRSKHDLPSTSNFQTNLDQAIEAVKNGGMNCNLLRFTI